MRYGVLILIITSFFMYNCYHDNKIIHSFKHYKKHLKMAVIAFSGLSLYLFIRKHPKESGSMAKHAAGIVRYLPIDRSSKDMLSPLLDMTSSSGSEYNPYKHVYNQNNGGIYKRSVSETKKKYVASSQSWRCAACKDQLDATYEIDHVIELQDGGSNDISNLEALCRNCHGKKTLSRRM